MTVVINPVEEFSGIFTEGPSLTEALLAEHPLSFADCFAVATARKKELVIVTGDPEFRAVEHLAPVEWL